MEAATPGRPALALNARTRRLWRGQAVDWPAALAFLLASLAVFGVFVFWRLLRTVYLSFHGSDIIGRPTIFVGLRQYVILFSSPLALWGAKNASGLGLPVDGAEAGTWSMDVDWAARCVDGVLGVVQGRRKWIVRPPT